MVTKILKKKKGWINRHIVPLPNYSLNIRILYKDVDKDHSVLCKWIPFEEVDYDKYNIPSEGYLGSAIRIEEGKPRIGFHIWEQNNDEFIYYQVS